MKFSLILFQLLFLFIVGFSQHSMHKAPDNLVNINTSNGSGTVIGSVGFNARFAQSMDFDDKTGVLYWAAYSFDGGSFRTIDTTTGMSTEIQPAASEFTVLSMGSSATVPVNIFAVMSIFIFAGGVVVIRFLRKLMRLRL